MSDFKQIYLRENNITEGIKVILNDVMERENISTASKAIIHVVESYPGLIAQIAQLKKEMGQHIREKHEIGNQLTRIINSQKKIIHLSNQLDSAKKELINLTKDETPE